MLTALICVLFGVILGEAILYGMIVISFWGCGDE